MHKSKGRGGRDGSRDACRRVGGFSHGSVCDIQAQSVETVSRACQVLAALRLQLGMPLQGIWGLAFASTAATTQQRPDYWCFDALATHPAVTLGIVVRRARPRARCGNELCGSVAHMWLESLGESSGEASQPAQPHEQLRVTIRNLHPHATRRRPSRL
ncbi:hypothetical protein VDGL01_04290 [Verticillium dahliae]